MSSNHKQDETQRDDFHCLKYAINHLDHVTKDDFWTIFALVFLWPTVFYILIYCMAYAVCMCLGLQCPLSFHLIGLYHKILCILFFYILLYLLLLMIGDLCATKKRIKTIVIAFIIVSMCMTVAVVGCHIYDMVYGTRFLRWPNVIDMIKFPSHVRSYVLSDNNVKLWDIGWDVWYISFLLLFISCVDMKLEEYIDLMEKAKKYDMLMKRAKNWMTLYAHSMLNTANNLTSTAQNLAVSFNDEEATRTVTSLEKDFNNIFTECISINDILYAQAFQSEYVDLMEILELCFEHVGEIGFYGNHSQYFTEDFNETEFKSWNKFIKAENIHFNFAHFYCVNSNRKWLNDLFSKLHRFYQSECDNTWVNVIGNLDESSKYKDSHNVRVKDYNIIINGLISREKLPDLKDQIEIANEFWSEGNSKNYSSSPLSLIAVLLLVESLHGTVSFEIDEENKGEQNNSLFILFQTKICFPACNITEAQYIDYMEFGEDPSHDSKSVVHILMQRVKEYYVKFRSDLTDDKKK